MRVPIFIFIVVIFLNIYSYTFSPYNNGDMYKHLDIEKIDGMNNSIQEFLRLIISYFGMLITLIWLSFKIIIH